jgi:hypothetical protein
VSRIAITILAAIVIAAFWPLVAVALLAIAYAAHVFTLKLEVREVCRVLDDATAALTQAKEELWQTQDQIETLDRARGSAAVSFGSDKQRA